MNPHTRAGFTIIELLVVITIIVVLLALLTPAMDKAIFQANHVRCMTNLRNIGQAQSLYLREFRQTYPSITTWNTLIGKNGSLNAYGEANPWGSYPHSPRILNVYMGYSDPKGEVPIAECPLDVGDSEPNHPAKESCYQQYGTSYLPAFGGPNTWFRVKNVYGIMGDPNWPSLRQQQISNTQNKMLLADWPWHANRKWEYDKTRWHGYKGTPPGKHDGDAARQLNVLFADTHVELFDKILVREIEDPYVGAQTPPDRTWKWW